MSETTEEGRPGRRSSSGPGLGRARGRGRSRGRGLLGITQQQQRAPGGQPTIPQSNPSNSFPESTSVTQDQFQDSDQANNLHEATESTGLTSQDSKPGIQPPSQIDSTTVEGSTYESALPSSTTQDCQAAAMVLTKLEDHKSVLIISVSSLPHKTSEEDIISYFERQGDEVEVCSVQIHDDERATIKIIGLTEEEQTRLQTRKQHKINKQRICVEITSQVPPGLNQEDPDSTSYDTLEIASLPSTVSEEYLELYFNSPRSGGCDDAVKSIVIIQPGMAHVQFHDPKVAVSVIEKPGVHKILGAEVRISPFIPPASKEDFPEQFELNKIMLHCITEDSNVSDEMISLYVQSRLGLQEDECMISVVDNRALITLTSEYTVDELKAMITKLESKPLKQMSFRGELYGVCRSIRVRGITKNYDDDLLEIYFENKRRSGGGEVESVELLGDGDAIVIFKDSNVVNSVMEKDHVRFGAEVTVERNDPLRFPDIQKLSIAHKETNTHEDTASITDLSTSLPLQTRGGCAKPDSAVKVKSKDQQSSSANVEVSVIPLMARYLSQYPEELKEEIKDLHVEVSFDEKQGKIICAGTRKTKSGWRQNAVDSITSHVKSKYATITNYEVPKDAAQELMGGLFTMKAESPLEFEFSKGGRTFSAVGRNEVIVSLKVNVQNIIDEYTGVSIRLPYRESLAKYHFLSQVKLPQMKGHLPPTVEISEDHSIPALNVQGKKKYVEQFQQMLPEISVCCSVPVNLDPDVIHYLQSSDGQLQLQSFVRNSIATFFEMKQESDIVQLILLGNQTDCESMKTIAGKLAKITGTVTHTIPQSFIEMQSELTDYAPLKQSLQEKHHVCIRQSANTVTVAGLKDRVGHAMDELIKFIMEKCTIVYNVEMERGELRLLQTYMETRWSKIAECCKASSILFQVPTLTSEDENSISTVVLKGEKKQVLEIFHQVSALKKSISKRSITVERAGTNYFVSENARIYLDGLEKRTNVVIEVTEPIKDCSSPVSLSDSVSNKFSRICIAKLQQSSCQLGVYIGDITDFEKAEVIVNAANCELKHIGGVAAAILSKGGPVIQEASDRYTKRKGKLATGDAWLSSDVGKLPCKALVHAVGPKWHNGFSKEEILLEKACIETLCLVSHIYQSIAFPAISSGIYGFPIDKCAKCMTKAIISYCESNPDSSLKEICIVLHSSKVRDAEHFISALKYQLPHGSVISDQERGYTSTHSSSASISQYASESPSLIDSTPSRSSRRKKSGRKRTSAVAANVLDCIKLTKGSLLDVKADVLVNTTNRDLNLSSGAVSIALLKAGGQQLQAECTKKAPINTGDVAVTSPGALPCRYVFHIVIPNYNGKGGSAEKVLRKSINKCLKECTSRNAASIAFPSIGTGNLHFPSDVVANIMVDEIINFLSSQKTSSIKTVYLVIFMPDTFQAFQQVLTGQGTSEASPVPMKQQFTAPAYQHMSHHLTQSRKYRLVGSRSSTKPSTTESSEGRSFTVGKLRIRIIQGDITEDDSDVIVNPTNAQMKLEGAGVAAALLRKGGIELQRLCNTAIGNIKVLEGDTVAKTPSAGSLKCKELFHINFEGKDHKKFIKIILACLNEANQQHSSIAFPAIGTGVHGYPPREAATSMLQAIQNFVPKSHTVKQIHIVIFQSSVYQEFVTVFQNPEKPGMFRRAAKYMESFITGDSTSESEIVAVDEETNVCEELEIKLFGETDDAVAKAERLVENLIDETFSDKNIDDPLIETLPEEDVLKLKRKCREMHVEITIDKSFLKRIRLKGNRVSVDTMYGIVNEVLREYEKTVSQLKQAKQLFQNVRWKRMDSDESEYSQMENLEIETAYQAQQPRCTIGTRGSPDYFMIDFASEMETDLNDGIQCNVVRVDLVKQRQEGERPSTWDQMPVDVPLHVVDLLSSNAEYVDTKQRFDHSMSGRYRSIVKIQRIQNPALYFQFIVRKKEMDKHNPPGHQNEHRLFHGTSVDTCPKINQSGFNRSFAGKNAVVHGNGVYFAKDASYSARPTYSPPDANGHKYIYLARVLSGEFTTGNSSMIVPPYKDPARHILYDSVVDNIQNPQIFVIFHDALVYPEYLIVFY